MFGDEVHDDEVNEEVEVTPQDRQTPRTSTSTTGLVVAVPSTSQLTTPSGTNKPIGGRSVKRCRKAADDPVGDSIVSYLKGKQLNRSDKAEIDEDETFMRSCVPALKRLSAEKRALAKLKINQLLVEMEFPSVSTSRQPEPALTQSHSMASDRRMEDMQYNSNSVHHQPLQLNAMSSLCAVPPEYYDM